MTAVVNGERPTLRKGPFSHIIERCWATNPKDRPEFSAIYDELSKLKARKSRSLAKIEEDTGAPAAATTEDTSDYQHFVYEGPKVHTYNSIPNVKLEPVKFVANNFTSVSSIERILLLSSYIQLKESMPWPRFATLICDAFEFTDKKRIGLLYHVLCSKDKLLLSLLTEVHLQVPIIQFH